MSLSYRPLTFLVLFAALPGAAWRPGSAAAASARAGPGPIVASSWAGARVESATASGFRVVVSIPAPEVTPGTVFGEPLAEINLPGGALDSPAGTPQLPSLTLLLRVPRGVDLTLSASPGAARPLGALRPEPLPHLISDRSRWTSLGAKQLSAYLGGTAYAPRGGEGAEAPLASFVTTAAGNERVLHVTLRPVRWDPRSGQASVVDRITLDVSWGPAATRGVGAGSGGAAAPRAGGRAFAYTGPFRVEPNRPWARLGVLRAGLYALRSSDLAAAGVSVAGIDPSSFRLFRATPGDLPESVAVDLGPDSLRECAITVTGEGDGTFDPNDRLYFYATGNTGFGYDLELGGSADYQDPQRSDEESLWLTWGSFPSPAPPRRMAVRVATPVTPAPIVTSVTHRVHYEENRIRDFNLFAANTRWERWFYRLINQGSRLGFPLALPGAQPGGEGSLFLRMWGRGISVGAILDDHYTNLYWNGALVSSGSWNFSTPRDFTASGFTVHASDTLQVQVPALADTTDNNRSDQSELAWFEVTYPRRLSAINDTLQFAADTVLTGPVHYVVDGISDTTAVWLLDRTDPESPIRCVNGSFSGAAAPFTLTAEDSVATGTPKRYALVSTTRATRPATITPYAPTASGHTIDNLLDPALGADYLIVVHPSLLASAESLAIYRSGRLSGYASPRVGIATTDRIAAQFGAGYLDPVAIRNLLAYARLHWSAPAPAYVCLFGDASLDPKNYLGFGTPDLVPTYANYYDVSLLAQFVSDDFYGFLDGPSDQLLDVAVGRLPAKSAFEASTLAPGKIRTYEESTEFDEWRARALLCADDSWKRDVPDPLGNTHVVEMERKDRLHIPYPIERSKVYLNDYAFSDTLHQSKPAARDEFVARVNRGNWLVDYIGHGSDLVLADEQIFRSSDMGRLTNGSRPALFGFFSCTVGKFDALGQGGLAELLLKSPTSGAAAALASTELVFPFESTQLNDEFVDRLFPFPSRVDSTLTVGAACLLAKNAHVNRVVRKYVLLGDPGLRPPIPRGRGVWEKAPLDSILRGDVAVIRGHALAPDSSADILSAGTVRIQVQGRPFVRTQRDSVSFPRTTTYLVPGPILYRGDVPLVGGTFEARFVVPVDARIAGGTGQLRALLSAAGGRGVGLAVDSIRVGQGPSSRTDLVPPVITLLRPAGPDSTFKPGDRLTFAIEDSSGIDLMRLDNAHTIFTILDDRGAPVELTAGFVYDPGSYTRGTVATSLPQVREGLHTIEVHASDTFGNIAVRTFVIDVHSAARPGDPMQLTQVFNYPNPFEGTTYVHARLNQPGAISVRILTVAGRRVRELRADGRAGENYLPWDGKDSQGENVAVGVYLLRVTAESPEGKRASAVGRALRKR